jgi:hypothetical protein
MEPIRYADKRQLHGQIMKRRTLLQATLVGLQADPQERDSEPARAVANALAELRTLVSGGWEAHDDAQSTALTRWLDSTQFFYLFDPYPTPQLTAVSASVQS